MTKNRIIPILLMILLVPCIAYGIGVSPVRKVVDFEPNAEYNLELKIRNDGYKDLKAVVYARGELVQYISIADSLVSLSKDESEKYARYKVKLPASFDRPGVHKAELVVLEYPSSFATQQEAMVSATASVVSELWVRVPYPGKYAEAELYIDAKNVKEDVDFAVTVMNFGEEDISRAKAKIKILGATYEKIAEIETDEISIKSKQQAKLTAKWLADVNPGKYHVIAEISYDGKKVVIEKNFEVGNLVIDIKKVSVEDFSLGQVAVFDILLESQWNELIPDVYGEMTVFGNDGTEYAKLKTASADMPAMGEAVLHAYWDTRGIIVGRYNLRLLIHYEERVTEKLIETEVSIDSIRTELGITAEVVAGKGLDRDTVLTVLVIILIAINLAWFVFFMRKKGGK